MKSGFLVLVLVAWLYAGLAVSQPDKERDSGEICAGAVQDKIAWNYDGKTRWNPANVQRLCQGAEDSVEPARCFERVMHGGVDWGGGTRWQWKNALALCRGTRNANATIACFRERVGGGEAWREAINACHVDLARRDEPSPTPKRRRPTNEDCLDVDPARVEAARVDGQWRVVENGHYLFAFRNRDDARRAASLIRHYGADEVCYVGRPDPGLTYLLAGGEAPRGAFAGEDCVGFDPDRVTIRQVDGRWKMVDGDHWLFDFGGSQAEAQQALAAVIGYGFTKSCYVGRPNPGMSYLRR